ncbi:alkaline shock response membrane anchor protein AmaP [Allokutzneria oryzae]|uniref:Alkaline shock response membrane anchor protein AmaP n=1 Tax=Allokutzneria oryzae TaxID=1378989 RepID=A0ABV6A5B1_9PSEU
MARSARAERVLTSLTGVLAVLAGAAAIVVGLGWLGEFRAQRSVLDPVVMDWVAENPQWTKAAGIALGVLLLVVGLMWTVRSLRPEHQPDMLLDTTVDGRLKVTAGAVTEAIRADAEAVNGVSRAKARLVGTTEEPALRLYLWLAAGTDIRRVWQDLDGDVLSRARTALGVPALPTAVRMELDTTKSTRVR